MLTIHEASKYFGASPVLNRIDLTIAANTVVGLAGPSGSGKSTLLRCIQGLEVLDLGHIYCDGKMGFMFQDFQLFPHMTVKKNLTYAPTLKDKTVNHDAFLKKLLTALGIPEKENSYPDVLSGGQKQRVALARSLMMQPDLLLCDEPTSGLDLATIDDVIQLLNTIKAMNVTMVIASHDLHFLTKMADRIIVLKKGKLVADVDPKTLGNPIQTLKKYYGESA